MNLNLRFASSAAIFEWRNYRGARQCRSPADTTEFERARSVTKRYSAGSRSNKIEIWDSKKYHQLFDSLTAEDFSSLARM
jgi:hypothetical protein